MTHKTCTGCSELLPLEAYNRKHTGVGGRESKCYPCQKKRLHKDYAEDNSISLERVVYADFFALCSPHEAMKKRACLRCQKPFQAKAANRICVQCKALNDRFGARADMHYYANCEL